MPIFTYNFYSVLIWALLVKWLPIKGQERKKFIFLGIIFIQFTYLAWQRSFTVGQDTMNYYYAFRQISHLSFNQAMSLQWEKGYIIWNWIISHSGFDFHAYLLFTGAFIYYSLCRFIYRYSTSAWLSIVIFISFGYYFGSLHILRQYLALAIIMFAYDYMLKRKLLQFTALVLLAFSFHTSAIIFLPTYFICNKNIRTPVIVSMFLICITLAFFAGKYLFGYLYLTEKYTKVYIEAADAAGSGYSMLVLLTAISIISLILKPRHISDKEKPFYWTFYLANFVQPFATIVSMVSRGILYWVTSVSIFLPIVIDNIRNKVIKVAAYAIVTIGLIIFFEMVSNAEEGIEIYATYEFYDPK